MFGLLVQLLLILWHSCVVLLVLRGAEIRLLRRGIRLLLGFFAVRFPKNRFGDRIFEGMRVRRPSNHRRELLFRCYSGERKA